MNRRSFLRALAVAGAGAALAPSVWAKDGRIRWRMVLAWSRDMELYSRGAFRFARQVSLLTESRLAIDVSVARPGMKPEDVVAMVERGEADCCHCFCSAMAGKVPAMEWFDSVPFGLDKVGYDAWLYRMGGLALWKEAALPLGLYVRSMGDAGPGVFAWSRRKLSGADSLRGVRIPAWGMAAEVLRGVGAKPQDMAFSQGADVAGALGSGALDAASWHGPHLEAGAGVPDAAPYGAGPSWQAPGRRMALVLNRKSYESLSAIVRKILNGVAVQVDHELSTNCAAANAAALVSLAGKGRTVESLDAELLNRLRGLAGEVAAERAGQDSLSARVRASHDAALAARRQLGGSL